MTATRARRGRPVEYGPLPQPQRAARTTSRPTRCLFPTVQLAFADRRRVAHRRRDLRGAEDLPSHVRPVARPRHWAAVRTVRRPRSVAHPAELARRLGRERPGRRMNGENWSCDVKFWNTDIRQDRPTPYRVRWVVAGQVFRTHSPRQGWPMPSGHSSSRWPATANRSALRKACRGQCCASIATCHFSSTRANMRPSAGRTRPARAVCRSWRHWAG